MRPHLFKTVPPFCACNFLTNDLSISKNSSKNCFDYPLIHTQLKGNHARRGLVMTMPLNTWILRSCAEPAKNPAPLGGAWEGNIVQLPALSIDAKIQLISDYLNLIRAQKTNNMAT